MKFKRVSGDEVQANRKDHLKETGRGVAVLKAAKAPASWDAGARSARFVMTTQQTDRYRDVVMTDGLDTTEFEKNPVGLLFHNSRDWPVAKWGNLEKTLKGRPPRMEGDFIMLPADAPARLGETIAETEWMLANGGIRACSIGFVPDWDNVEMILDDEGQWTYGYRFNKSELVECSICAVPANPGALVKSAGGDMKLAKELLEDILDNWVRSPAGLLMSRKDFEAQYRMTVEEIAAAPAKTSELPADEPAAAAEKLIDEQVTEPIKDATVTTEWKDVPADTAPASSVSTIKLNLDASQVDAEVERVGGLLDGLGAKIAKMFGRRSAEPERIEPKVKDDPVLPPPEVIEAARARAAETLARLKASGVI